MIEWDPLRDTCKKKLAKNPIILEMPHASNKCLRPINDREPYWRILDNSTLQTRLTTNLAHHS